MAYPLKKAKTKGIENLSARVYHEIKGFILRNEIMPGQKLQHQELSERLGVSRTPVREALTRLVQEGYVRLLPNRGFICKEIRMQEAEELYDLARGVSAHQEHLKLLEAIRKRNLHEAVKIIRSHIQEGKRNVLADLKQRKEIRDFHVIE